MGLVIGPVSLDDWYLARMLRESIVHMKSLDNSKYRMAIDVHTNTYRSILRDIVRGEDNAQHSTGKKTG